MQNEVTCQNQKLISYQIFWFQSYILCTELSVLWVQVTAFPLIPYIKRCFLSHLLKNEIKENCKLELGPANFRISDNFIKRK